MPNVKQFSWRGNKMEYINNQWIYSDTQKPVFETYKGRNCGRCKEPITKEGHDACLGTLKGLMNACCGHGEDSTAYVQFWDGSCIRGKDAIEIMNNT